VIQGSRFVDEDGPAQTGILDHRDPCGDGRIDPARATLTDCLLLADRGCPSVA
jgi:hypothetical protein